MHSFDSLARSMASPSRSSRQPRRSVRHASVLAPVVALGCALLPLGIVVQAWLVTV